jgi:hypothetical protein
MNNSSHNARRKTLAYLLASLGASKAIAQAAPINQANPSNPAKPSQSIKKPASNKASSAFKDKQNTQEKAMAEKKAKVQFPDSPYDMWQSAIKLLDLNNIVITAKAIEEAFGFTFDIVDKERGKSDMGNSVYYSYERNSERLGLVKIFALEWKDRIRWGVEWSKNSCDIPMRTAKPQALEDDLSQLGWHTFKKGRPIGKTNSDQTILDFFPIDRKRFENPQPSIELPTQVGLIFPSHNEECFLGMYINIVKVN